MQSVDVGTRMMAGSYFFETLPPTARRFRKTGASGTLIPSHMNDPGHVGLPVSSLALRIATSGPASSAAAAVAGLYVCVSAAAMGFVQPQTAVGPSTTSVRALAAGVEGWRLDGHSGPGIAR